MATEPHAAWRDSLLDEPLQGTRFAARVTHLSTVNSTNTLATEAAQAGAPEGSVWVADEQTAGRGRGGHHWHSEPRAGLYFSVLLRPRMPPAQALWLSLATGLAVQSAVANLTGTRPDIRWPNDLLFADKKFGGILVETATSPAARTLRHAVVGIGINVAHADLPPDLRPIATSILLATGQRIAREALLAAILQSLDCEITLLETELSTPPAQQETLLARFSRASTWVCGKPVQVGDPPTHTGTTAGLDSQGFLRILTPEGTIHTVLSGGVRSL